MNTLAFLSAFVSSVFVKTQTTDFSEFAQHALVCLQRLFAFWELEPIPDEKQTKGATGTKAVSHNSPTRFYVRARKAGLSCPLVLKPLFDDGKTLLYGYYVAPDIQRIKTLADLEAFCLVFWNEAVKRHEDFEPLILVASATDIAERIANNTRQDIIRRLEKADKYAAMAQPFIDMEKVQWDTVRKAMALDKSNNDLLDYIDEKRTPTK